MELLVEVLLVRSTAGQRAQHPHGGALVTCKASFALLSCTRVPDCKGYKFTAENVALLLQAAMKDVSPKA